MQVFKAFFDNLEFFLDAFNFLVGHLKFLFSFLVVPDLLLQNADSLCQLDAASVHVCVSLELRFQITVHGLQLGERHRDSQFLEQELELVHRVGLPLFQVVDFLLHKAIFLRHVCVHGVVLAANEAFLLLQNGVLARESEQVEVEDRVLFGEFN